ncbi:hypothetical protein [Bizionia myxarmorum]|uniref:hypothetical protein n=1 Tax=Bizionia myxarmorum TaxID=291186 RepID=UPI001479507C|nr:hypothetical protein [Bizionia myxarmorum]
MITQTLALYNWNNGVVMIAIFAFVCIALVAILLKFVMSGKPKEELQDQDDTTSDL